jgi:hypothetical protein
MVKISSTTRLKETIHDLELKQAEQRQILKEKIDLARESLKPSGLFKTLFSDAVSSPDLISNILGSVIGIIAGNLSKRIFIGSSLNQFKRLLGNLVQLAVTAIVSERPELLKSFGQKFMERIFGNKMTTPESNVS